MPLFIMISGFLSKKINFKKNLNILYTYLICQVLVFLLKYALGFKDLNQFTLLKPNFALWYLLSLFLWKSSLPYVKETKHPLIVAVILGVLCGYSKDLGSFLALKRAITFFPYFLLGYFMTYDKIKNIRNKFLPSISIPILTISLLGTAFVMIKFNIPYENTWFNGGLSYITLLKHNYFYGWLLQLVVYTFSLLISLLVICTITDKKNRFLTFIARNTLYIYVWHIAFVIVFEKYFLKELNNLVGIIIVPILVIIIIISFIYLINKVKILINQKNQTI